MVSIAGPAAVATFREVYGREPRGVWAAPGRVNLIGEHTDYNEGFVLPVAVDRCCRAYVAPREDGLLRCHSVQFGAGRALPVTGAAEVSGWSAYAVGVAWELRRAGYPVGGADVLVDSDVPAGAGLASSAALECSVGLALLELAGRQADRATRIELALAAQRAETDVAGAPVGVMDQLVSVLGEPDRALFLDCRSLRARTVPLPLARRDLRIVVLDTGVRHEHATGGYGARRRDCAEAARLLGVPALRDAAPDHLDAALLGPRLLRRARHVVTENARVLAAVAALDGGEVAALPALLAASHASLRDDFEVSVVELDTAVDAALGAGAFAARMTGGGFGGSAVALVPADRVAAVGTAVRAAAAAAGLARPQVFEVVAGPGARRVG